MSTQEQSTVTDTCQTSCLTGHYTVTLPGTSPHFALTLGRLLQRVEEMQEYVESATGHIASLSLRGLRKVVQWAGGSRAAE